MTKIHFHIPCCQICNDQHNLHVTLLFILNSEIGGKIHTNAPPPKKNTCTSWQNEIINILEVFHDFYQISVALLSASYFYKFSLHFSKEDSTVK